MFEEGKINHYLFSSFIFYPVSFIIVGMSDFAQARKNMVDCQIHPFGVSDDRILTVFEETPREHFVTQVKKSVAYNDEDLFIEGQAGRYILEPSVHAKMVQYLDIQPGDVVLDIGAGTGYSSVILASMASTVIAVEDNPEYAHVASKNLEQLGVFNVAVSVADLHEGSPDNAPYDKIFVGGAVAEMDEPILEQMADNGRLIAIVKNPGEVMGHVTMFEKNGAGSYSQTELFSSGAAYLPGFEPKATFSF